MKVFRIEIFLFCTLLFGLFPQSGLTATGDIITVAGGGVGDGGAATAAFIYHINHINVDNNGNLYIADTPNQRIRKVYAGSGIITTVAGSGFQGYAGDNGTATAARLNNPCDVALDNTGNLYIVDSHNQRIRKVDAVTGIITTVAGSGVWGFSGDNGPATAASFAYPWDVAVDSTGNLYIADADNHRIRKVDAVTGIITTVAGNGVKGYSGDTGAAIAASLNGPMGISLDSAGNLYIAEWLNHRIRKVDAVTGIITTVAGNGVEGFSGDTGAATTASLKTPRDVTVDRVGNLYIADSYNLRIRKVELESGIISTVAGNGTSIYSGDGGSATATGLRDVGSLAVDGAGNLFISDENWVRKVDAVTRIITTVTGNGAPGGVVNLVGPGGYSGDNGPATSATLFTTQGVALDNTGNIFIADSYNNRIRKVANGTGIITTVAGNGTQGYSGDNVAAISTSMNYPTSVTVDSDNNIYFADYYNHRIRKVDALSGIITTIAGNGIQGYSGDGSAATGAMLNYPRGVEVDSTGNVYISDGNGRIRKITGGIITTVAGDGRLGIYSCESGIAATTATLYTPYNVVLDQTGNIYIADSGNNCVRKVDAVTGIITTVAGSGVSGFSGDNGPAIEAKLTGPRDVTFDGNGNLYIGDSNMRVRKVAAVTGIITTVAGSGVSGFSGDNGPATAASMDGPAGIAFDSQGNLYIADSNNFRIRKVIGSIIPVVVATPDGGTYSWAQNVSLTSSKPAMIFYTTDGTDPTTSGTRQTFSTNGQLNIPATTTLKYYAVDPYGNTSSVVTRSYIIFKSYFLNLTIAGSGSGSVHSSPLGIACSFGLCLAPYNFGTSVTLMETPDNISTFGGWGGACTNSTGDCTVSMTTDKIVTSTFTAAPKAMIGSTGYTSLATAYSAATNNAEILLLDTDLLETLVMHKGITFTIKGGYHADYLGRSGNLTAIKSPLTVKTDILKVNGVRVK